MAWMLALRPTLIADIAVALLVWASLEEEISKPRRSENLRTLFTIAKHIDPSPCLPKR